jgi:nucleoid-associated protein YgaU
MRMPRVRFTVRRLMVAVALAGVICALATLLRHAPYTHRVGVGENFWTIAKQYYGTGRYYRALWYANRDRVNKLDELYVGTTLRIPSPEELNRSMVARKGVLSTPPK